MKKHLILGSIFLLAISAEGAYGMSPVDGTGVDSSCVVCGVPKREVEVLSGPVRVEEHVRYLTSAWAKADGYTWNESVSVGSSVSSSLSMDANTISSQIGVNVSVEATWGVGISIPADSSRDSRLELKSLFEKRMVKVKTLQNGLVLGESTGEHRSPVKDEQRVVVAYR